MFAFVVGLVVGFVVGTLFAKHNQNKVNKLAAAADKAADAVKAKLK